MSSDLREMIFEIARKQDVLIQRVETLSDRQSINDRRQSDFEERLGKVFNFIDQCTWGRRALLWILGGVGAMATVTFGIWDRFIK